MAALEAQQWRASTEHSLEYARNLAAKAAVALQVRAVGSGEGCSSRLRPVWTVSRVKASRAIELSPCSYVCVLTLPQPCCACVCARAHRGRRQQRGWRASP